MHEVGGFLEHQHRQTDKRLNAEGGAQVLWVVVGPWPLSACAVAWWRWVMAHRTHVLHTVLDAWHKTHTMIAVYGVGVGAAATTHSHGWLYAAAALYGWQVPWKGPEKAYSKGKPAQRHDQGGQLRWQPWQPRFNSIWVGSLVQGIDSDHDQLAEWCKRQGWQMGATSGISGGCWG